MTYRVSLTSSAKERMLCKYESSMMRHLLEFISYPINKDKTVNDIRDEFVSLIRYPTSEENIYEEMSTIADSFLEMVETAIQQGFLVILQD